MNNTVLCRKAPISYESGGRQFVEVGNFLACYPDSSDASKEEFEIILGASGGDIEKRVEVSFLEGLMDRCWESRHGHALYGPIVLRDGWVIWTNKSHELLVDVLGKLFAKSEVEMRNPIHFLTGGHGWYISTMAPGIIYTGRAYQPTRDDEVIFAKFKVRYID